VGVEKVHFSQNNEDLGDRKCLGKPRESFVVHPNAILFSRILQEGIFQQPRLFSSTIQILLRPAFLFRRIISGLRVNRDPDFVERAGGLLRSTK
jgi:hypothetical protein